jgi:glycosyltransferase involved in cell wall biosynthesis
MNLPKVSINLCCYNSDWELVIINDGSSDSTQSIIKEYMDQGYPIAYHYQENKGLGYSRNVALSLSRGDYIAFIDHDDMWVPEKLARQVVALDTWPGIDLSYSNFFVLNDHGQSVCLKKRQPEGSIFGDLLRHYHMAVMTVVVRRKALSDLGILFNSDYHLSEEFELFMRLLYRSQASYIHEPLAYYRIHREMGSLKFIDEWPIEMERIILTLKRLSPTVEDEYKKEFEYLNAKIGYYYARAAMSRGDCKGARKHLRPHLYTDYQFFLLYVLSFLPAFVWKAVHTNLAKGAFGGLN